MEIDHAYHLFLKHISKTFITLNQKVEKTEVVILTSKNKWGVNSQAISKSVKPSFLEILERGIRGEKLTVREGERLLNSTGREFEALVKCADRVRRNRVGEVVTYIVNRNINFTNICTNRCRFCAFFCDPESPEGYLLTPKQVRNKTRKAVEKGATEICMQGGIHPSLGLSDYLELLKAIRSISQKIHIHAFSPAELYHISEGEELPLEEVIQTLREEGLDSVPGTAAEILVERVRKVICPNKISAEKWERAIKTCHRLGVPTTATIMYGHVETPHEIALHLKKIRDIQKETGGFTELVPLAFASENTMLGRAEDVKDLKPNHHRKIHAVARLMLNNYVENIQSSWVKLGPKLAQRMLNAGANDLSGTLMEENITRSAGGERQEIKPIELRRLISDIGRIPVERTTTYELKLKNN